MEKVHLLTEGASSEASVTASKITESLIKNFLKDITSETTADILGALGGGIGSLIIGTLIKDYIDPPAKEEIVDYTKIEAFVKKDINLGKLDTASSGVYKCAHYLFNNYKPLRSAVVNEDFKISDLVNLAGDLDTALKHMTNTSIIEDLGDATPRTIQTV